MKLRFWIDPETGEPHIYNHGIVEHEVEEVLSSDAEESSTRGGSRIAIGRTFSDRLFHVVYAVEEAADCMLVITAYELRGKKLKAYRRRRRRKR